MEFQVSPIIDVTGLTVHDLIKKIVQSEITLDNLPAHRREEVIRLMKEAEEFAAKQILPTEVLEPGVTAETWESIATCFVCRAKYKAVFANLFIKDMNDKDRAHVKCGHCGQEQSERIPRYLWEQLANIMPRKVSFLTRWLGIYDR